MTVQVSRNANKYLDIQAPWSLKKTDPDRMQTVLWVVVSVCVRVCVECSWAVHVCLSVRCVCVYLCAHQHCFSENLSLKKMINFITVATAQRI